MTNESERSAFESSPELQGFDLTRSHLNPDTYYSPTSWLWKGWQARAHLIAEQEKAEAVAEVFGPKAVSTMIALKKPLPPGTLLYLHPAPSTDRVAAQVGDVWRCFHCAESFTTRESAAEHFGTSERQFPACTIDVAAYREMEQLSLRYQEEDTELHRAMYRMESEHQVALRREEEQGYARGLRDAKLYPDEAESLRTTPADGDKLAKAIGDGSSS